MNIFQQILKVFINRREKYIVVFLTITVMKLKNKSINNASGQIRWSKRLTTVQLMKTNCPQSKFRSSQILYQPYFCIDELYAFLKTKQRNDPNFNPHRRNLAWNWVMKSYKCQRQEIMKLFYAFNFDMSDKCPFHVTHNTRLHPLKAKSRLTNFDWVLFSTIIIKITRKMAILLDYNAIDICPANFYLCHISGKISLDARRSEEEVSLLQ